MSGFKRVLLTTDTPHHRYFAWRVGRTFPWQRIVLERGCSKGPDDTETELDSLQRSYDEGYLARSHCREGFSDLAETQEFDSVNDSRCVAGLEELRPDQIIIFGTGILKQPLIDMERGMIGGILNLHGGDPETYRGLDSHLWAIYHEDWESLVTTLHHVDSGIDTGHIVVQDRLWIGPDMKLDCLRMKNTEICVNLVIGMMSYLGRVRPLPSRPQRTVGRYYSHMPATLKGACLRRFNRYVKTL